MEVDPATDQYPTSVKEEMLPSFHCNLYYENQNKFWQDGMSLP